ncbi:MAG: hypothetical protein IKF44_00575, partial [Mycoplasmataceae bacterium]|nr:hypothetical protein [Mycoplasmataceae bacterium]
DKKWIDSIEINELPHEIRKRYKNLNIPDNFIDQILSNLYHFEFIEKVKYKDLYETIKIFFSEIIPLENKLNKSLDQININPEDLKQCLTILEKGEISGKQLKQLIPLLVDKKDSIENIIKNNGFKLISDKDIIVNWIKEVQNANPNLSNNFNEKKESTIKFIAGEIMKKSKGQANPILTIELIKEIMGG